LRKIRDDKLKLGLLMAIEKALLRNEKELIKGD